MATFEFNGKTIYIDGRLKEKLEKLIFPELQKKDKDAVFIVDGKERSGKSKFSDALGAYAAYFMKSHYGLDSVCMTPFEFKSKVMQANKNDVIIYDEAHRGMGSRRALSEINNILIDLMMEMGQKNLFVIIVLPTFFMLDRYPALYRARGLFHVYERGKSRGFWVYFNTKRKERLYLLGKKMLNYNCMRWPPFKGRFTGVWAIDEEAYRRKKANSFKEKPRETKMEVYMEQRNAILYLLDQSLNEPGSRKLVRLLEPVGVAIKERQIREILEVMRGKFPKNGFGGGDKGIYLLNNGEEKEVIESNEEKTDETPEDNALEDGGESVDSMVEEENESNELL